MNSKIKECFNKAADTYDANCYIQKIAGKKLMSYLSEYVYKPDNILELGCGTGIVTEILANHYNNYNQFYALDIADKLVAKAQKKLSLKNINFCEENFDFFSYPNISFNLACSNMALQWSANLDNTLLNIYKHLASNGVLAFSLPVNETFVELEKDFYSLESINESLIKTGFKVLNFFTYKKTYYFDSLRAALDSIKNVGAHSGHKSKINFRKLLNEKFSLTYNIGFFIAKKYEKYEI